jgi:hypothetical protein
MRAAAGQSMFSGTGVPYQEVEGMGFLVGVSVMGAAA